jgi:hypothetical protein
MATRRQRARDGAGHELQGSLARGDLQQLEGMADIDGPSVKRARDGSGLRGRRDAAPGLRPPAPVVEMNPPGTARRDAWEPTPQFLYRGLVDRALLLRSNRAAVTAPCARTLELAARSSAGRLAWPIQSSAGEPGIQRSDWVSPACAARQPARSAAIWIARAMAARSADPHIRSLRALRAGVAARRRGNRPS